MAAFPHSKVEGINNKLVAIVNSYSHNILHRRMRHFSFFVTLQLSEGGVAATCRSAGKLGEHVAVKGGPPITFSLYIRTS